MAAAAGTLWLVPNALDLGEGGALDEVLPAGVLRRAAAIGHWVAEEPKAARLFLRRVAAFAPLARPLQEVRIEALPRPRKGSGETVAPTRWRELLAPALAGEDLGLISDAGLPAVADPGAALVAAAHAAGVAVVPLPGPSALMLALAASGLDGQCFAFAGYLPQDAAERGERLRALEAQSRRLRQTQLVIETPYRNTVLRDAMLATLAPQTRLAVACGLTWPDGFTRSDTVAGWRARPTTLPDRRPAVFAFLA